MCITQSGISTRDLGCRCIWGRGMGIWVRWIWGRDGVDGQPDWDGDMGMGELAKKRSQIQLQWSR